MHSLSVLEWYGGRRLMCMCVAYVTTTAATVGAFARALLQQGGEGRRHCTAGGAGSRWHGRAEGDDRGGAEVPCRQRQQHGGVAKGDGIAPLVALARNGTEKQKERALGATRTKIKVIGGSGRA